MFYGFVVTVCSLSLSSLRHIASAKFVISWYVFLALRKTTKVLRWPWVAAMVLKILHCYK